MFGLCFVNAFKYLLKGANSMASSPVLYYFAECFVYVYFFVSKPLTLTITNKSFTIFKISFLCERGEAKMCILVFFEGRNDISLQYLFWF